MVKRVLRSLSATAAIAATCAIAPASLAVEPPTSESAAVPVAVNEIFFGATGPYSNNRTVGGQLATMFGAGGFSEQRTLRDVNAITDMYVYLLDQQSLSDPTIRVPDLPNPYETTILYLPTGLPIGGASGSEFIFETGPIP
jgi:hypothetical protein